MVELFRRGYLLWFVRSAYAGSQQWTVAMWSGDPEADWSRSDGLPAHIVAGLNAGLSGMPFWGSDIGGFHALFVPPPTSELHKRWVQFGAFCGLMQPNDAQLSKIKREFYFGPDIYVAPIWHKGARTRTLYLPAGDWVELWKTAEYDTKTGGVRVGGSSLSGGKIVTVDAPIAQIPLFVRRGSVIPLLDPEVDTLAPASPPTGVSVTTAAQRKDRLFAWAFVAVDRAASATLSDGSTLTVSANSQQVTVGRSGGTAAAELHLQLVLPPSITAIGAPANLTQASHTDPFTLTPGQWTFSKPRNTLAIRTRPGQRSLTIQTGK